jgi:hypothetical protein
MVAGDLSSPGCRQPGNRFWRALGIDAVALFRLVPRHHETMARIEGKDVSSWFRCAGVAVIPQHLASQREQCTLARVAAHIPLSIRLDEGGVIAEGCDAGEFFQACPSSAFIRIGRDAARRSVTVSGHGVGLACHSEGRHHHLLTGQRTGLVHADRGRGTQGLDGRQPPHNGILASHGAHAQGRGYGENSRQSFRDCGNRQADIKFPLNSSLRINTPIATSAPALSRMSSVSQRAKSFICIRSGVCSRSTLDSGPLILPISVSAPVAMTTPFAWPLMTIVSPKARQVRSRRSQAISISFHVMAWGQSGRKTTAAG